MDEIKAHLSGKIFLDNALNHSGRLFSAFFVIILIILLIVVFVLALPSLFLWRGRLRPGLW